MIYEDLEDIAIMKLDLTDAEWLELLDGSEDNELASCCRNVSELRNNFVQIVREGRNEEICYVWIPQLEQSIKNFVSGHLAGPILKKVIDQLGFDINLERE